MTCIFNRLPFAGLLVACVFHLSTFADEAADTAPHQDAAEQPSADRLSAGQMAFFEKEVRPLLARHCWDCHGEEESSGDLRLDSLRAARMGGSSGPAVVPGKPEESILVEAIRYESYEMPPSEKLSDREIQVLTRWVEIGAPWPGEDPDAPIREHDYFDEEDRSWWAIQSVRSPEVPDLPAPLANWPANEIDAFVAGAMLSHELHPAPRADRISLVRRAYLDVIGLPPTPEQVNAFLSDDRPDAWERLVDSLLDSKAYGEHAARQWLDLARYAESDGYRADEFRPHAYHYRDYVIDSFNDDKPYDRFIQEQLAADELFPDDLEAQAGLTYLRHWVYEWNIRDARTQWKTIMEDVTDTTADVFLGLGLQCAKCHNHKFDPLLQKDYFRLQAFLSPIMPQDVTWASSEKKQVYEAELAEWKRQTKEVRDQIDELERPYKKKYRNVAIDKFPKDLQVVARKAPPERTPLEEQLAYLIQRQVQAEYDRLQRYMSDEDKEQLIQLQRELKQWKDQKPEPLPTIMTVSDVGAEAPLTTLPKRPQANILPGPPTILDPDPIAIESDPSDPSGRTTGRRAALAKWISDPSNPLTARVMVNRIWQSYFGRGLAENPSDFGRLGGPPSHPRLLDWMADRFMRDGWSIKSLRRKILLSQTYQQSTSHPQFERFQEIDPGNAFYWRRNTNRMTAEQIRDSLLAVSGQLKTKRGGPSVLADSPYRTVYTRVMRNSPDQLLGNFDLPQFFTSQSARNTTTTPLQSLFMINSDRLLGHARRLASLSDTESDDAKSRAEYIWKRVYGRQPSAEEIEGALAFVNGQQQMIRRSRRASSRTIETSKLPYRDGQAVKFTTGEDALHLSAASDTDADISDLTIESFFQLRSITDTGEVRTIAGQWNGSRKSPGWRFGVTGAGSRRKPQTLVLQLVTEVAKGKYVEHALFSDQFVDINTPYYASACFELADDGTSGRVTFYLKDLSNDDEPLMIAEVSHEVTGRLENDHPFTIGSISGARPQPFDGLIDDVRWADRVLDSGEILYASEREVEGLVGFWQFESDPGVMKNSLGQNWKLQPRGEAVVDLTAQEAAWADLCHALLNSNEFLYVH